MNKEILTPAVQDFLERNAKENPKKIALKKSPFAKVSSSELATQLESRQKAEKKLPHWFHTTGIYYPPSLSIEQSSSEDTAESKSNLIGKNTSVIDLTGGIGVDSYYFSKKANRVVHCELNSDLSKIAQHNAHILGAQNIDFIAGDGIAFLNQQEAGTFQVIYLDPSRRVNTRKVFMLNDCEPNVIALQDQLLSKAPTMIIKTAPLLDISLTLSDLKHVKEVHIISLRNECKELLFLVEKDVNHPPILHVTGLTEQSPFTFSFLQEEEKQANAHYGLPLPKNFLFDPDVALLKAGCFKLLSQRYQLDKLHPHTHLYTSSFLLPDFPGRIFEILDTYAYTDFKKQKNRWKANVITRNFPLKVEELRKKHKIAEDTDHYLFFCKALNEKLFVIHGKRLS